MRARRNRRHLQLTLTIVAINTVFGIDRAHAQSAEAEKLFGDGNRLMAAGKLAEACTAFEASNRAEPRAGTLIHLGECREKTQQFASAWSAYNDARRLATDPHKRKLATTKVAALGPRLSYLTVAVSSQVQISGLELTRNGKPFDPTLWNNALPVDGGDYVIAGRAPGYKPWQQPIHVPAEGAKLSVDVPALTRVNSTTKPQVPRVRTPAVSPTPPAVTVPVSTAVQQNVNVTAPSSTLVVVPPLDHPRAPPQTSSGVAPFFVGTGALVLLGGGLGFELWAESTYTAAKSEMTSQLRRDTLYHSANTKRYVAEGLAAAGLAAAGAAVWLYLRNGNREHDATTHASVRVVPMATSISLSLLGQF